MIEQTFYGLLSDLVEGRVYPDTAPDVQTFPLITYQQVSGTALWFGEQKMPDHKNARIQVNVWARTRNEASQIAAQVEQRLCEELPNSQCYGAITSLYDGDTKLYGTRQDFGVWYQAD